MKQFLKNSITPALLLLVLCSGVYRHDKPIENYLSLAQQEQFNGVGQLISIDQNQGEGTGSFVMLDSVTALSAAHCFMGEKKKDTVVVINGVKYETYLVKGRYQRKNSDFRFFVNGMMAEAKKITLHPEYFKDGSCDIAIIRLQKPVRGIKKIPYYTLQDELHDTVTGVGYGVSGPGNEPSLVAMYHIKLGGKNLIDSIGGKTVNGISTLLFADFDRPYNSDSCNSMGSSVPLDLEYGITGGDSGGPLFAMKNNRLTVVGVAAHSSNTFTNLIKNGYYCEIMGWTRVSAFAEWISKTIK